MSIFLFLCKPDIFLRTARELSASRSADHKPRNAGLRDDFLPEIHFRRRYFEIFRRGRTAVKQYTDVNIIFYDTKLTAAVRPDNDIIVFSRSDWTDAGRAQ